MIHDVVYNHLGPSGNYLPEFGPYLKERLATPGATWSTSTATASAEVRRYILDNARMWLEDYHVDGLRLDAVHALRRQLASRTCSRSWRSRWRRCRRTWAGR